MMMSTEKASQPSSRIKTSGLVDWGFAKATGRRLVQAGPAATPGKAAEVVASLRSAAQRSRDPVAETARMHPPEGSNAVLIVDRSGWIDANVDSLQSMLEPVITAMQAKRKTPAPGSPLMLEVGGKVTGAEVGTLTAFLASRILGQYDLAPDGTPRLLLVAPNVLHTETELGVNAADFRLWICLHEETHRVQFTAVPWLRQHVIDSARRLALDLAPDPEQLGEQIGQIARNLPDALRSGGNGLTDIFATAQQRAEIAKVTAIMSLLELRPDVLDAGHDCRPHIVHDHVGVSLQQRHDRSDLGDLGALLSRGEDVG